MIQGQLTPNNLQGTCVLFNAVKLKKKCISLGTYFPHSAGVMFGQFFLSLATFVANLVCKFVCWFCCSCRCCIIPILFILMRHLSVPLLSLALLLMMVMAMVILMLTVNTVDDDDAAASLLPPLLARLFFQSMIAHFCCFAYLSCKIIAIICNVLKNVLRYKFVTSNT